jgi:hypothetical protein
MPYKDRNRRNEHEREVYHRDIEETRRKSRERVAKFAAAHPERYKAMRTRAAKKWYDKNRAHAIAHHRGYRQRVREEVIDHYGRICVCCGETEFVFLTIDHINGGGNKHRKSLRKSGTSSSIDLLRWIKNRGFPPDFQVLCWNCNHAKCIAGICPHRIGIGVNIESKLSKKGDYELL